MLKLSPLLVHSVHTGQKSVKSLLIRGLDGEWGGVRHCMRALEQQEDSYYNLVCLSTWSTAEAAAETL